MCLTVDDGVGDVGKGVLRFHFAQLEACLQQPADGVVDFLFGYESLTDGVYE